MRDDPLKPIVIVDGSEGSFDSRNWAGDITQNIVLGYTRLRLLSSDEDGEKQLFPIDLLNISATREIVTINPLRDICADILEQGSWMVAGYVA
jgi:hypothetical protein